MLNEQPKQMRVTLFTEKTTPGKKLTPSNVAFLSRWISSCEMADILNEPIFDDRIVKIKTHTYNLYANTTIR